MEAKDRFKYQRDFRSSQASAIKLRTSGRVRLARLHPSRLGDFSEIDLRRTWLAEDYNCNVRPQLDDAFSSSQHAYSDK